MLNYEVKHKLGYSCIHYNRIGYNVKLKWIY